MRHLVSLSLVALALLLEPARLSPADPAGAGEATFSRARWIEAHEVERRFDAGALPGRERRPAPSTSPLPALASRARIANVLVSPDLLRADGSSAQAETQAEPFLAIDPGDERRLLAGYQEARFQSGGARALAYAVSTNQGRRWRSGLIPNLTEATGGPWQKASDPWVAFGPDHRAYFVSLAFDETRPGNAVVVSTSVNGGLSWSDPVTVHHNGDRDHFDDKEAIAVDNGADSPFRGRVYVAWDTVTENRGQPVLVSWSADGGVSFSPAVTVVSDTVNVGVIPLVGPGGVVHLVWSTFSGPDFNVIELLTARSEDGGATWSAPVRIDQIFPAGIQGLRTGDFLPAAAVDPGNGNLYVVWADARDNGGTDRVLLSSSTDGGASWTPAAVVSDGPEDAGSFTPAVAVDGSGRVGVAYHSLRNDPDRRFLVDEYLATSTDGGATFGASRRISPKSWNATFAAFSRGYFLGDYQALVGGKNLFHALFVATYRRSAASASRNQPDVFTAQVR